MENIIDEVNMKAIADKLYYMAKQYYKYIKKAEVTGNDLIDELAETYFQEINVVMDVCKEFGLEVVFNVPEEQPKVLSVIFLWDNKKCCHEYKEEENGR